MDKITTRVAQNPEIVDFIDDPNNTIKDRLLAYVFVGPSMLKNIALHLETTEDTLRKEIYRILKDEETKSFIRKRKDDKGRIGVEILPDGEDYVNRIFKRFEYQQKPKGKIMDELYDTHIDDELQSLVPNFLEMYCKGRLINKGTHQIDFKDILGIFPRLASIILDYPEKSLKWLEYWFNDMFKMIIKPHIVNLPKTSNISPADVRTENVGHFLAMDGIIQASTMVKSNLIRKIFKCPACSKKFIMLPKTKELRFCSDCGYKGTIRQSGEELENIQYIRFEECTDKIGLRSDPKSITILLKNELANPDNQHHFEASVPLVINGIAKCDKQDAKGDPNERPFYVEGRSIKFNPALKAIKITDEDIRKIKEFARQPGYVQKIAEMSFCDIYGMDMEKLGLLMSAVSNNTAGLRIRDDIHVLLIGDPGTGKSTLLRQLSDVVKSRWVSGKSTTGVGLIASVTKDELSGSPMLQKGAMAISNNGIVICDELDKMATTETDMLHEPLENQSVVINKWNKHQSFETNTTFIASANPKYGRFEPSSDIVRQINLPKPLINRFDLIFAIIDDNLDNDAKIVDAINRKIMTREDKKAKDFVRKYIAYAQRIKVQQNVKAGEIIKDYFCKKRKVCSTQITARQYEALVRLASAHAKLRLSPNIEEQDFIMSIKIMEYTHQRLGLVNYEGIADIDKLETYVDDDMGKRRAFDKIFETLKQSEFKNDAVPIQHIQDLVSFEIDQKFLNSLVYLGIYFQPSPDKIELLK